MYYTSADAHERHAYIDKTVEAALEDLRDPEITRRLGSNAVVFKEMLSSLVVPNIEDGVVQLPDTDADESVPVLVLKEQESVMFTPGHGLQDRGQRENTIKVFEKWQPGAGITVEDIYAVCGPRGINDANQQQYAVSPQAAAETRTHAKVLTSDELKYIFERSPEKGLIVMYSRPILILNKLPTKKRTEADAVLHELTHIKQVREKPVFVLTSQHSANMTFLRAELEAYHMGYPSSLKRYAARGKKALQPDKLDQGFVQLGVVITHEDFGIDPDDPYRPSGALLARLRSELALDILHAGGVDYDALTLASHTESMKSSVGQI